MAGGRNKRADKTLKKILGKKDVPTFTRLEAGVGSAEVGNEVKPTDPLASAFEIIQHHLSQGHKFSFEQIDLGIELSLAIMPEPDQEWFREIASSHGVPLWQCLWAQWRRCHDNGLANALILDPGWQSGSIIELEEMECSNCHKMFKPERWGMVFCSNPCGAEAERKALGLPPKEQLPAKSEPASKKDEGRVLTP